MPRSFAGVSQMATTAGFKQQCPSCEAMVSVRDESLIGRKIDCPKCKYRFIVEPPEEMEREEEEKKEKKRGDKPAKGKNKAAANNGDSGNGEAEEKSTQK